MAPQVGFEPTTDRLTADSSTTELLRNEVCLAMSYSHGETPTTIGAEELNFRVRHGNGCDLFAIITRRFSDMYYYTMYFRKARVFEKFSQN